MSSFINYKNCGYTPHPEVCTSESMVMSSGVTQQSSKHASTFNELLKNVWTSEETQTMARNPDVGLAKYVNPQKQGSLTRSQKTVDEVWKELVKENGMNLIKEPNLQPQVKQPTLGEVTLEVFLHEAGVVSENGQTQINQIKGFHQSKPQKILPKQAAFNFPSSLTKSQMGNGVSRIVKSDHPTNSNLDRSPSPRSYAYGDQGGVCGRNMVVERRRKRMIKNRESAARSRARKQAYTLELEAEVAKLKQLNHELKKKQEEIMESHSFQAPEKMKLGGSRKSCLRRTVTGPW